MSHWVARIDETQCIGCTKCIAVCPVDAIVGAAKQMHSIIAQDCTGCENCVSACPVHCIDLVPTHDSDWEKRAQIAEARTQARIQRIEREQIQKKQIHDLAIKQKNIKAEIQACLLRYQAKKNAT